MKNCIVTMVLAVRARKASSTKLQAASTFSSHVGGMASEVCQKRGGGCPIQAEALDSKSACDITASLASTPEEFHWLDTASIDALHAIGWL
jgi:hypothetical protein